MFFKPVINPVEGIFQTKSKEFILMYSKDEQAHELHCEYPKKTNIKEFSETRFKKQGWKKNEFLIYELLE